MLKKEINIVLWILLFSLPRKSLCVHGFSYSRASEKYFKKSIIEIRQIIYFFYLSNILKNSKYCKFLYVYWTVILDFKFCVSFPSFTKNENQNTKTKQIKNNGFKFQSGSCLLSENCFSLFFRLIFFYWVLANLHKTTCKK